ncbi:MAG TPA: hypothetical protein VLG71_02510, partial [Candidatus Limnocylindria bacterium]|nr:hypothetical protein [Candidatus Limnocylindria bacterium]
VPVETTEGFEVFRMKEVKTEKMASLSDRYREIANILRKPLYERLMSDYKKKLFDASSIIYF